ncbi:hypothetical protein M1446_00560 [Candidatus Dependentiae bacterium]|nr:hypothetical protein [Candidatus Dependentiae bacterium]
MNKINKLFLIYCATIFTDSFSMHPYNTKDRIDLNDYQESKIVRQNETDNVSINIKEDENNIIINIKANVEYVTDILVNVDGLLNIDILEKEKRLWISIDNSSLSYMVTKEMKKVGSTHDRWSNIKPYRLYGPSVKCLQFPTTVNFNKMQRFYIGGVLTIIIEKQ